MKLTKQQTALLAQQAEEPSETPETHVVDLAATLDRLRGERSYYSGLIKGAGIWFTVGPVTTVGQAHKLAEKWATAVGGEYTIAHHWTPEGLTQHLAEVDAPAVLKGDWDEVRLDAQALKNGWDGKGRTRKDFL